MLCCVRLNFAFRSLLVTCLTFGIVYEQQKLILWLHHTFNKFKYPSHNIVLIAENLILFKEVSISMVYHKFLILENV